MRSPRIKDSVPKPPPSEDELDEKEVLFRLNRLLGLGKTLYCIQTNLKVFLEIFWGRFGDDPILAYPLGVSKLGGCKISGSETAENNEFRR